MATKAAIANPVSTPTGTDSWNDTMYGDREKESADDDRREPCDLGFADGWYRIHIFAHSGERERNTEATKPLMRRRRHSRWMLGVGSAADAMDVMDDTNTLRTIRTRGRMSGLETHTHTHTQRKTVKVTPPPVQQQVSSA
jgi:hypothetical protein